MKLLLLIPTFLSALCLNNQTISEPKLPQATTEICFKEYGVLYSTTFNIPLASYEHLNKDRVSLSTKMIRKDQFHQEKGYVVKPIDYRNSGYDKGHMTPCDDMSTTQSQYESFSMVNMVPQKHGNNAGAWKVLEESVRNIALTNKDVYVVSGVIIDGNETKLKNTIIPNTLYKGVYIPKDNNITIYTIQNIDKPQKQILTEEEFKSKYNIDLFPKR